MKQSYSVLAGFLTRSNVRYRARPLVLNLKPAIFICITAWLGTLAFSRAQSIYSPNVAGFVRVPLTGGGLFNLVANPLNNTNNSLSNLFAKAQDGDEILTWNAAIQDLDITIFSYSTFSQSWDGNRVFKPGEGFFYVNTGNNVTNVFVGDVIQGSYTNPVPVLGLASFNSLGSSIPIGGSFTNAIDGLPPSDGDEVLTWNVPLQDFDPTIPIYSSFFHGWNHTEVTIDPGIGFFYLNAGPSHNLWVRNFTVP